MKIIYNSVLPFRGYSAMMFFGVILAKKRYGPLSEITMNHEEIHREQARDCCGYLSYYIRYLRYCFKYGYENNPFEAEAYYYEEDLAYLNYRQPKDWEIFKK